MSLTEIAAQLKIPKSSLVPFLHTMARRNFVFADSRTHRYGLGLAAYYVGLSFVRSLDAEGFARRVMRAVVEKTREMCQLGILDHGESLYLLSEDNDEAIRIVPLAGRRVPAYATAIGKALLSGCSDRELAALFARRLQAFTASTLPTLEALQQEIARVRSQGYALSHGELRDDVCGVAVPFFQEGRVKGAIGSTFPAFRSSEQKIQATVTALREAAAQLEQFIANLSADPLSFAAR